MSKSKKTVFVVYRLDDGCILGVYSTLKYAELKINQCFDPNEIAVERHTIDDDVDDILSDG